MSTRKKESAYSTNGEHNIGFSDVFFFNPTACGSQRYFTTFMDLACKTTHPFSFYVFSGSRDRTRHNRGSKIRYISSKLSEKIRSFNQIITWDQFLLPEMLKQNKIDLYHSFNDPIPCSDTMGIKFIISFFDIIPWTGFEKEKSADTLFQYKKKWMPPSLKRADKILSISQKTKEDIIELFSIDPGKIEVIYPFFTGFFSSLKNISRTRRSLYSLTGIEPPYILNCNTLSPRKNIETLIKAFVELKDSRKINHSLVIVGSSRFYKVKAPARRDIIFTGEIDDRRLRYLYNLADIFVYPSLYEGFGYPALEAMACKIPTITSNAGSLPEVAGKDGITFDPNDVDTLSKLMLELIQDHTLRKRAIKNGIGRVEFFSHQNYAGNILNAYRDVLKR